MGYTTEFTGSVTIEPPLSAEEVAYLNKFSGTRRMDRRNGPYFVAGGGYAGQDDEPDVIDHNHPPEGQPGLWCQWVPNEEGTEIEWDGNEKFYAAFEWMEYLIEHFIGNDPLAKVNEPENFDFIQPHTVNGDIHAAGEESGDLWKIEVRDNVVEKKRGHVSYDGDDD